MFPWRKKAENRPDKLPASLPAGQRVYAVGDVHGRFDLLHQLIARIEEDNAGRPTSAVYVVLLGDLINRGPQSREVIDFFLKGAPAFAEWHFIMGNHEEMLLRLIDQPDAGMIPHFLRFGGRETFESYGAPQIMLDLPDRFPPETLPNYVPEDHRSFMRRMEDGILVGDYFFTHAGIKPGVPLEEQQHQDLHWIRKGFLESDADHGMIVVHGHTVLEEAEVRPNRIGIDTGAYASGKLTALGLEGAERWFIQVQGEPGR